MGYRHRLPRKSREKAVMAQGTGLPPSRAVILPSPKLAKAKVTELVLLETP